MQAKGLKDLLAKATPMRSGDALAGIAAATAEQRMAARMALAEVPLKRFLDEGDKCKITLRFRGREITHQDIGMRMLERIRDELADVAMVEHMPKLEGRQMIMVLAPKRK